MKRAVGLLCVTMVVLPGCAKSGVPTSAMPQDAGADVEMPEVAAEEEAGPDVDGESRDFAPQDGPPQLRELQAEFSDLDRELAASGVRAPNKRGMAKNADPAKSGEPEPAGDTEVVNRVQRCTRICELRVAICDVSERICSLAEEHTDDSRYAQTCERSQARCEQATQACESCSSSE